MVESTDVMTRAKELGFGPKAIADRIGGITSQAVSQWRKVPAERVLDLERITGIPRHEIRPDLYPPPETVGSEQQQ